MPKGKRITLKGVNRVSEPYVRGVSMSAMTSAKASFQWTKINPAYRRLGNHQHNLGGVFPPREVREFALLPGPATVRAEAPGYAAAEVTVEVVAGGLPEAVVVELRERGA